MIKLEDSGERLAVVETKMTSIEKKIDEHYKRQREDFNIVFDKLDNMSGKFAGKWVEKIAIGLIVSLAGLITTLIMRGALR